MKKHRFVLNPLGYPTPHDTWGSHRDNGKPSMQYQQDLSAQHGFTLTELVTVIVILGVLSVAALPLWFNRTDFEQRGYFDELLQATRYAQKLAVASNCNVQITINAASFALAFQSAPFGHCNNANIELPGKPGPYTAPAGVVISGGTNITFSPSGRANTDATISVDTHSLRVYAATGYVERQ